MEARRSRATGSSARSRRRARRIQCATRLHPAMAEIGLRLRAGIHCGEVELREPGIAGIAVHIAARVQAKAVPGETLVTSTTRDMVTASS